MSFLRLPPRSVMASRDGINGRIGIQPHVCLSAPGAGSLRPFNGRPDRWGHFALVLLLPAVVLLFAFRAQAAAQVGDTPAESEIRAVADAFRQAIIDKDDTAFTTLFLNPSTATWVSVESDARLAAAGAAGRPISEKVNVGPDRTPLSFIRGIVQSPQRHEETMENLRVATDGEIASVHFEFAYLRDGQTITTGEEAWLLVRTVNGWRIVSVVWSKW